MEPIITDSPEHKKTNFDPRKFSLDANQDGRVDVKDFEEPPDIPRPDYDATVERINAPVEDERGNIRRLKKLKAQDILDERKRRREEELADRIIDEEERRQRQANKSPFLRGAEKTIAVLGDGIRGHPDAEPVPFQGRPRRAAPIRQVPQQPSLRSRLNQFGSGISGNGNPGQAEIFAASLLPRQPTAPGMAHIDHLAGFSASILGRGAASPKRQRNAAVRPADPLKTFSMNLLGKVPGKKKRR